MKRIAVTAVAVCSVALGGCGGASGTDQDQVRDAATAYYEAYTSKDFGKVCDLMGPSAEAQLMLAGAFMDAKGDDCPEIAAAISAVSDNVPQLSLGEIRVDGDKAIAVGGVDNGSGPSDIAFERVKGRWLVAAEPDEDEGLQERAKAWPDAWCGLEPGATRDELRAAMGKPTTDLKDQDGWSGFGVSLTAFYDADLKSYQLQVGEGTVPCAKVRQTPSRRAEGEVGGQS